MTTPTPLYIFDLDGTLSDPAKRLHLAEEGRWVEFYKASQYDPLIVPTALTLTLLVLGGAEVQIWTGRGEEARRETESWLYSHGIRFSVLRMRPAGSSTKDDVLKQSWLLGLTQEDRGRLVAAYEDRSSVVDMWRQNGVVCYQVAKGDF